MKVSTQTISRCLRFKFVLHRPLSQVEFTDGAEFELHGLWLRDACRDENFVSEVAGERYLTRTGERFFEQYLTGENGVLWIWTFFTSVSL